MLSVGGSLAEAPVGWCRQEPAGTLALQQRGRALLKTRPLNFARPWKSLPWVVQVSPWAVLLLRFCTPAPSDHCPVFRLAEMIPGVGLCHPQSLCRQVTSGEIQRQTWNVNKAGKSLTVALNSGRLAGEAERARGLEGCSEKQVNNRRKCRSWMLWPLGTGSLWDSSLFYLSACKHESCPEQCYFVVPNLLVIKFIWETKSVKSRWFHESEIRFHETRKMFIIFQFVFCYCIFSFVY